MSKLTDIRGIGPARAAVLAGNGYTSVEALAKARPEELAAINGIGLPLAKDMIKAAKALIGKVESAPAPEAEAGKPHVVAPAPGLKLRAARGRAGAVKRKPRSDSLRKAEKRAKPAAAAMAGAPAVPDVPLPPATIVAGDEPGALKKAKVRAKAAKALKKAEALAKAFEAAEKKAKKKAKKAKKKEKEAKAEKKAAKAKG
ncbi:helix-hairpin-helix domain-containing protein [Pseudodonghicola sp.]|uniref:helix-hairpin-helix domain-containing protein n=1 Tax=Pseudodonghicola sp. TaxID=1969463 RepID=UPI003A97A50F